MSIITILGAGMMGSAMSFPASDNGHTVRIVGTPLDRDIIRRAAEDGWHITLKRRLPQGITFYYYENLDEALQNTDLLISGVSSFGVEWFAKEVLPKLDKKIPVLSVTKGMFNLPDGRLLPYPHYYRQFCNPETALCAVGGPCTSYELADRDPTEVCFCGDNLTLLRQLRAMLQTDYYHISISEDVVGVECAVAMKNAYALGVSLAIGLSEQREGQEGKEHYNSQAALFGQSVREMRRLLTLCGGKDENIVYGAGDLYVTVFGGRTRKLGILLGRGLTAQQALQQLQGITLESVVIATRTAEAVRALVKRGSAQIADFPLLLHIDSILQGTETVHIPWRAFTTETSLH